MPELEKAGSNRDIVAVGVGSEGGDPGKKVKERQALLFLQQPAMGEQRRRYEGPLRWPPITKTLKAVRCRKELIKRCGKMETTI